MECVRVEKLKNQSKMSLAAKKAWETIRAKKQLNASVQAETKTEIKQEKKKKAKAETKAEAVEVVEKATVWDKKELAKLNGDELVKLAKGNGKRAEKNIKKQMKDAKVKAVEVGSIIKDAIQNVNGFKAETKAV